MHAFDDRTRLGPLPYVFGALLGVSLGLIIVSGVFFFKGSRGTPAGPAAESTAQTANIQPSIDASRQNAIVEATRLVAPAVVSIASRHTELYRRSRRGSPLARDWLEYFFGVPETTTREVSSLGSGVVISDDGYILTNDHVVRGAEVIEITLFDGRVSRAYVVDTAPDYDLALVKVDETGLPYAVLGDSDSLQVGEWAIAIGQPFGQFLYDTQPTVTVGVISALHRDIREEPNSDQYFKDMIQTDAAINPGNSGGPLVNARGEVIGINSFIFSNTGGNLGMGFAIPINLGKWVLEEIETYGRVRRIWVGLHVQQMTPQMAAALGIQTRRGLLIRRIEDESPAAEAGLKPGDLILSINGTKVVNVQQADRLIFGSRVGDNLDLEIDRKGSVDRLTMTLKEKPNEI